MNWHEAAYGLYNTYLFNRFCYENINVFDSMTLTQIL